MNQPESDRDGQQLIALLRAQLSTYGRLRGLSQRQRLMITGDPGRSADRLLEILRERQSLVREIVRTNEELAPLRRNWQATCDRLTPSARAEVAALVVGINESLSAILSADKEDEALLAARREVVADELSGLTGGQRANRLYAAASDSTGASADFSG